MCIQLFVNLLIQLRTSLFDEFKTILEFIRFFPFVSFFPMYQFGIQ